MFVGGACFPGKLCPSSPPYSAPSPTAPPSHLGSSVTRLIDHRPIEMNRH